jgi:hypothetical protein
MITIKRRERSARDPHCGRVEGSQLSHLSAQFCHPPFGAGHRHPVRPGIAWPQGYFDYHDLHARLNKPGLASAAPSDDEPPASAPTVYNQK